MCVFSHPPRVRRTWGDWCCLRSTSRSTAQGQGPPHHLKEVYFQPGPGPAPQRYDPPPNAWPRPPRPAPRKRSLRLLDTQAAAASSSPVHACALAVARGLSTHVPRATGRATRAASDGEACEGEQGGESLDPEPEASSLGFQRAGSVGGGLAGGLDISVLRKWGPGVGGRDKAGSADQDIKELEAGTPWF